MKSLPELCEVPCNICGLKEEEVILNTKAGKIVRCKKCGLYYLTPRLSDEAELYKYQSFVYDDFFCETVDWAKKKIFLRALKKLEPRKGRILDIGCANGFFLALAREKGWKIYGTEISDFFIRKAKENLGEKAIFSGHLKEAKFPSDFFDVITLWDVLDHLLDPLEELKEIRRILKKEGALVIRVRNMAYHLLINKLFKKSFLGIIRNPSMFHLYGFNKRNIRVLLERADFAKIKVLNSKLTSGDPYSQAKFLGISGISLAKRMHYAFSELARFLSFNNLIISPSIIIHAEKS